VVLMVAIKISVSCLILVHVGVVPQETFPGLISCKQDRYTRKKHPFLLQSAKTMLLFFRVDSGQAIASGHISGVTFCGKISFVVENFH
jgi:hypothetical protein